MSAGKHNLSCDQGSTFERSITWKDSNGSAVNVSNYNARMDVRFAPTKEADLVLQLTQSNGRLTRGANVATGTFLIVISAADTASLTPATYFYDLEVFTVNATDPVYVQRLVQGKFTVNPEVTG